MKKTYILLALSFVLIGFSACKKEAQSYTISGTINDGSHNKALAGATVQLLGSKIESGVYNSNYVEMASAVTDAAGNYTMEIKDELVAGYRFYIHKDEYFDSYVDVPTDVVEKESTFTQNQTLYAQSTVKLKIRNTTPTGPTDEIIWRYTNIQAACRDCCNTLPQTGTGGSFQTETSCLVRGEKWVHFEWTVTKGAATAYKKDSVFCPAFGTGVYDINY